jgi:hypothetical protein
MRLYLTITAAIVTSDVVRYVARDIRSRIIDRRVRAAIGRIGET